MTVGEAVVRLLHPIDSLSIERSISKEQLYQQK